MPKSLFQRTTLRWDVMLIMTKIKLELILDADMYIVFEKGMTSLVSYISNRYSKVNNKYLKPYDPKQGSQHIIYLDVNNVYGYQKRIQGEGGHSWCALPPPFFFLSN